MSRLINWIITLIITALLVSPPVLGFLGILGLGWTIVFTLFISVPWLSFLSCCVTLSKEIKKIIKKHPHLKEYEDLVGTYLFKNKFKSHSLPREFVVKKIEKRIEHLRSKFN